MNLAVRSAGVQPPWTFERPLHTSGPFAHYHFRTMQLLGQIQSLSQPHEQFKIVLVRTPKGWTVEVRVLPEDPMAGRYLHEFDLLASGRLRSALMDNFSIPAYTGKGLPAAVILFMGEMGFAVESSPPQGQAGVFRNTNSEKVWARLKQDGLASLELDHVYRLGKSQALLQSGSLLDGVEPSH
jgi:hypothetical protein